MCTSRHREKPVLELSGVSARYGSVPAIHDVSIHIGEGEAVGLLGANGAGKSTTLRLISGLVRRILGSGPSLCARGRPLLVACVRSGATLPAERRVLAAARARRWARDRRRRGASVAPALPDRRGEPPRALPRASLVCGGGGGAPHPAPPLPAKLRPLASLLRDQLAAMPSMFAPSGTATV